MLPIYFDRRDAVWSGVTLEGCCEKGTIDVALVAAVVREFLLTLISKSSMELWTLSTRQTSRSPQVEDDETVDLATNDVYPSPLDFCTEGVF